MVEMRNVRKIYDSSNTVALDRVDFSVEEGEFVFLVGISGSGKSTIIKLITGEVRPTSGRVIVNGYDMAKIRRSRLPKMRRTLGVIFQDFRLIDNMTVYDNVAFAMRVVGARNRDIRKRVPYVLELVGLDGRERRFPNELSGGEQQRVAIARALVNNPRMIVADEPTGNLDPVRSLELMLLCETNLDAIREAIAQAQPKVVIIDSIQTMFNESVSSAPGSVSQVRESTGVLMQIAKGTGVSIFIVGHVTKEGVVAGPRVLEHMVDTVLYFEGDRLASYRILRAVKNRFGSTNEVGVFEMREDGLREVTNPSEYLLEGKPENASGSVVACSLEGTRPILIEVQALVCQSNLGIPRRTADGADANRVNLLIAVLEKRLGLRLSGCDAYVNITGGIRLREPAVDLGIVLAIISSYREVVIDEKTIVFGEVGLSGEIRAVSQAKARVQEAVKLGFETVILPQVSIRSIGKIDGIRMLGVRTVRDLYALVTG